MIFLFLLYPHERIRAVDVICLEANNVKYSHILIQIIHSFSRFSLKTILQ